MIKMNRQTFLTFLASSFGTNLWQKPNIIFALLSQTGSDSIQPAHFTHGPSSLHRKTELRVKAVPEPDIKGYLKSGHCLICHSDECLTWARSSVKH